MICLSSIFCLKMIFIPAPTYNNGLSLPIELCSRGLFKYNFSPCNYNIFYGSLWKFYVWIQS